MRLLSFVLVASIFSLTLGGVTAIAPGEAFAQATCRAKCASQEQACLKRTYNKGQCGGKAQACMAKCK